MGKIHATISDEVEERLRSIMSPIATECDLEKIDEDIVQDLIKTYRAFSIPHD